MKVSVSAKAIHELLTALNGPSHLVRELQALRNPPFGAENPINILIEEFNCEMERIKTGYLLYPFLDDETATLWSTSDIHGLPDQEEISHQQLVNIFMEGQGNQPDIPSSTVAQWSRDKIGQANWDVNTLIFDSVAIVSAEHAEMLKELGETLQEFFGSDGPTYRACKAFNTVLKRMAVKVLPFPGYVDEAYYEEME
jgi:hypothetical protein